jgi:membrane-bound ClpP family serine protease
MIGTLAQAAATAAPSNTLLVLGFALFGAALVLLALELLLPSAGILPLLCGLSVAAGIVCFFLHSALWGFTALAVALGGAPFVIGWALGIWTTTPLARRSVLSAEVRAPDTARLPEPGTEGRSLTDLRPVGRVEIGGRTLEAIAETGFVEAGSAVVVVAGAEGGTLRVRPQAVR